MNEPMYFQAEITDGKWKMVVWIGKRRSLPSGWTVVKAWKGVQVTESYFFPEGKK